MAKIESGRAVEKPTETQRPERGLSVSALLGLRAYLSSLSEPCGSFSSDLIHMAR